MLASLGVHGGALATVLARPAEWPWALGAVVANHALLATAGLWPRSRLLGPNWTRLPAAAGPRQVAITIDDGPDPEITPRVLAQLAQYRAPATFFCIGERVGQHPQLARAIAEQGHAVENHSQHHLNHFSLLGPRGLLREIEGAQELITAATGRRPQFFRAPAGLRSPLLGPLLQRLGLQLASWTRRGFDTVHWNAGTVYARLIRDLGAGDILLLHDGHAARTRRGVPVILEVLPRLLDAVWDAGLEPVTLCACLT